MATAVQIIAGKVTSYSTSAARYITIDNGGVANTTESLVASIVGKAGTFKNLRVNISSAPGTSKSFIYTVYKNGSPTTLTVTISGAATTGYDDVHEISFAAGDYISLEITPSNTPTASTTSTWACDFSTTTNNTLLLGSGATVDDNFYTLRGRATATTSEFFTEVLIPCSGTISDFYLRSSAASGSGKTITYTVRKNGGNTALVVSLAGASDVIVSDLVHSFSVAAGDTISIARTGDTTAQGINTGLIFTPDTEGNFILSEIPYTAQINTTNAYCFLVAASSSSWNIEGNADQNINTCTIKNMYVELSAAPSATQIFTLRKNVGDTILAVSIDSSSTTGNDTGDVAIVNDDMLTTKKNATSSQAISVLISYTGYRVDISTLQKTVASDMMIKATYFDTINSNMKILLDRVQENILSDMIIKTINQKTLISDMKIKVLNNQGALNSDMFISHSILNTINSDMIIKKTNILNNINSDMKIKVVDNQKTLLSNMLIVDRQQETINSDMRITVVYNGKFIHNSDLYIITDSSPANIIKVDMTNPTVYTIYPISGKANGKALYINHTTEFLYASLNNGYVVKVSLADPSIQTLFYVGENKQLYSISHNPNYLTTFIADDVADDSLFVLDEATYSKINSDIRTRIEAEKTIETWIGTIKGGKINSDFRTKIEVDSLVNSDLRFNIYHSTEIIPMARTDFHIFIDTVELGNDDLKLDSIRITHTADNKDMAEFILLRKHDAINTPTTITANNVVTIYLGTRLEFTGRTVKADCNSQGEYVQVYCSADAINSDYNIITKELPLSSLNTQLHIYDVLLNDIMIDNPYVQSTDEENYKGVKINLGTQVTQNVEQWIVMASTQGIAQDIEAGTFIFKPNYTYFWQASVNWYDMNGGHRPSGWQYIGTSLASLSTDLYEITGASPKYQKVLDDTEVELGYYYLGTAPYKEISAKNGKKICRPRWEDKDNGLYTILDESYDYVEYCKAVAAVEYEKIKNINGDIFPKSSANIDLTIDAYLYYGIKLLTRLNITNTTTTNIYKGTNGFPISAKQITIDSSTMKTSIVGDNNKSDWELERLTETYPVEPAVIPESAILQYIKFDLSNWEEVDE